MVQIPTWPSGYVKAVEDDGGDDLAADWESGGHAQDDSEEAEVDDTKVNALITEVREVTKLQIDLLNGYLFPFHYQNYISWHPCTAPEQPHH